MMYVLKQKKNFEIKHVLKQKMFLNKRCLKSKDTQKRCFTQKKF